MGVNEVSLGLFTALLGLITIVFIYKLALELAGKKAAFLAGMAAAISPFMVYASNDARPYAFLGNGVIYRLVLFPPGASR